MLKFVFRFDCFHVQKCVISSGFWKPIGLCNFPVVANVFMDALEHYALTSFALPPLIWIRYVDDTFCIFNANFLLAFLDHLNSICSCINFTLEKEKFNCLSFLNVTVYRNKNNSLSAYIKKKPPIQIQILQIFTILPSPP